MSVMITFQELVTAAKELPVDKRLSLMEELAHSLVEEWQQSRPDASSLERVRGLLRGEDAPSARAVREEYTDYLIEKYE
jgi:hypothetical protein